MKLLIVDDNADKLRKLIEVLCSCGVDREGIDVSRSAADARNRLRVTSYDIAIIDLLLPNRDEDRETLETSLDLLREVCYRDDYRKPTRLIGFTAFSEAATDAQPCFAELLWTIVLYDETSNGWEEQFRRVVAYVNSVLEEPRQAAYAVDLCVVTALHDPELEAIHRIAWNWEASEPMDESTFVRFGSFRTSTRTYSVVSACAPRMGNVAAALLTSRLIAHYRPRFLVMAGICAGVKTKVNYGDVVLFSPSWEWASGKVVPDSEDGSYLQPSPHQIPVAEFVLARAEELRKDVAFWAEMRGAFPTKPDTLPKLIVAPAASGPSVIAHKDYAESIRVQHRKLTAIDMEAYGVTAAASSSSSPRPTAFAMKSVCDFADEEKNDSMQAYAAYTSARTIQGFFERNLDSIYELAGG